MGIQDHCGPSRGIGERPALRERANRIFPTVRYCALKPSILDFCKNIQ